MERIWKTTRKHLNFYRIHIIFFVFTPLLLSAIFYASNGKYHISYVDSLFNCVSAMTVCGLATVDLSSLTGWQQTILFLQMCLGSPVFVSWVIVYIRKFYFAKKFKHIIEARAVQKTGQPIAEAEKASRPWPNRLAILLRRGTGLSVIAEDSHEDSTEKKHSNGHSGGIIRKVRPDMIRRMDDAPKLVNPSGWISEGGSVPLKKAPTIQSTQDSLVPVDTLSSGNKPPISDRVASTRPGRRRRSVRRLSDPGAAPKPASIKNFARYPTVQHGYHPSFPRTQTVEFVPGVNQKRGPERPWTADPDSMKLNGEHPNVYTEERQSTTRNSAVPGVPLATHATNRTHHSALSTKHRGFGGFPMPMEIITNLVSRFFPRVHHKLFRTVTIPLTTTITTHRDGVPEGAKSVPYISFDAVVGRNSVFHLLTSEQLEELGGVEYRALNALLWIIAGYHLGVQILAYVVIAPYISARRWRENFVPPQQHRTLSPPWYALFQVVSSYTNTGISLVDQSMIPFQRAYPMIALMAFLILAGNTTFPILLRFTIWILTKIVPVNSRANETLHFLLDHPRRCFIYLFPSHQTWFLLTVVMTLTFTDWFFFLVLDIGNPALASIPAGVKVIIGFLQAIAVRAAGFGTVSLSALAPAVKVLYVIMMYISVYPIAMSVRSTNVYEEQSLGIYHDDPDDEDDFEATGTRVSIWGRYLAMHARRQLAFDMWWLGLAIFLVCIIERPNLDEPAKIGWFNIFSIVFELVSAYGTVGLSLGIPTQNYSFSGSFRPLSKLIVCLVMLRGRHRGLPVAIDRAVMVPAEFQRNDEEYLDYPSQPRSPSFRGFGTETNLHETGSHLGASPGGRSNDDLSPDESQQREVTSKLGIHDIMEIDT